MKALLRWPELLWRGRKRGAVKRMCRGICVGHCRCAGAAIVGASWATYHFGSEFAEPQERNRRRNEALVELTAKQESELAEARKTLRFPKASANRKRKLWRSRQAGQIAVAENAALKDDLAFSNRCRCRQGRRSSHQSLKPEPDDGRIATLPVQGAAAMDFQPYRVGTVPSRVMRAVLTPPEMTPTSNSSSISKPFQRVRHFQVAGTGSKTSCGISNGARTPKLTNREHFRGRSMFGKDSKNRRAVSTR